MAVRLDAVALGYVVLSLSLAGCGGGGGGSSGPTGGGTGGPTPTAAKPGNALMLHATATSSTGVSVDGNSPQYGSTVNIASSSAWAVIPTGSTVPTDLPADVLYDYHHTPAGVNIYRRPVTVTMSGGTGGLTGRSATGTEYVACATTPGANGCGDQKLYLATGATQDAQLKVVTYTQDGQVVATLSNTGTHQYTERRQTLTQVNSIPELYGDGSLEHSYVGQYSDATLTGTLTSGVTTATSGEATTGWYFGGDATGATEMSNLMTAAPKATYQGAFEGKSGSINSANGGLSDVMGQVTLQADFGNGTMGGNVYNMTKLSTGNALGYGIAVDGTIIGSTYTGSAQYTAGGATDPGVSGSGQVIGGFFGANAVETAGVIDVQGAQPGGTCTVADCYLQGAFGAKKQ